jgi:mannose-1-phosphate guanylyltransferase/mannose-6-phosphate isomerase
LRERITVLGEPVGRNTAPAIAYGMAYLRDGARERGSGDERTVLVLPADHVITPQSRFKDAVTRADTLSREGYLVTFGVTPGRPETGYGYIEAGEPRGPGFAVSAFTEKPDRETAQRYIDSGNYYWNSGMFVFPTELFERELARHAPDVSKALSAEVAEGDGAGRPAAMGVVEPGSTLEQAYENISGISIDYALMENSDGVAMVPAEFTWNDVGSWDEIAGLRDAGVFEDKGEAPVFSVESGNNYVLSDVPVALCGVEDLVVVLKNDRLLLCKRGRTQLVKQAVDVIAGSQWGDLL